MSAKIIGPGRVAELLRNAGIPDRVGDSAVINIGTRDHVCFEENYFFNTLIPAYKAQARRPKPGKMECVQVITNFCDFCNICHYDSPDGEGCAAAVYALEFSCPPRMPWGAENTELMDHAGAVVIIGDERVVFIEPQMHWLGANRLDYVPEKDLLDSITGCNPR